MGILKQTRMQYMEQAFLAEYKTRVSSGTSCRHLPKKEKLAMYLYRYEFPSQKIIFCVNPEKYIDYETGLCIKMHFSAIANNGNTVCIVPVILKSVYSGQPPPDSVIRFHSGIHQKCLTSGCSGTTAKGFCIFVITTNPQKPCFIIICLSSYICHFLPVIS